MPAKEVEFQQDLYYVLRDIIVRHPEFEGVRFETARMEYDVDHGRADIAVLKSGGKPFLILETKRKAQRVQHDIDPLSPAVISQALSYAVQSGAPYFATANPSYMAVFRVPDRGEPFRIERHRVIVSTITGLTEAFASRLLETLVKYDKVTTDPERSQLATDLDWTFIIRLRSFVDWLTRRAEPAIESRMRSDQTFRERLDRFERESGVSTTTDRLARQMSYILMNKILFHKVLERSYPHLNKLTLGHTKSVQEILETLARAWQDATSVTLNFEAIFSAGLYDDISLAEDRYDLLDISEGVQGFIDDMETYRLEELGADVIGHVAEKLIEPEERHLLGQFYTPPTVAEFLTHWGIRGADDLVLDPAVGSGTFLVKAYERLRDLKVERGLAVAPATKHREILSRLYAIDINPFAAHLTAMNLAMRDVRFPVTETNILERDFFKVSPGAPAYVPYVVRTPSGERRREISVPLVDLVVGNPPYTRWLEIPGPTRDAIQGRLGPLLRDYGLTAVVRGGIETAIYQHFMIHGHEFLKEGGRLAMIISNSWLQTDVGVKFASFMLDHFKIHAVIDLGPRIFEIPLVSTCLVLLERCSNEETRVANPAIFAYLHESLTVAELDRILVNPEEFGRRFLVRRVRQGDLPRDRKWIEVIFGLSKLESEIQKRTIPVSQLFDVTRGNIQYCADKKRGLGANEFFYLTPDAVRMRGLEKAVVPCLESIRHASHFTFGRRDWEGLHRSGKRTYLFHCRKKRDRLSSSERAYVEWGETRCRTRTGDKCSESQACAERGRSADEYRGWYDVGEVRRSSFFTPRYSQYRRRFVTLTADMAMDDGFLAYSPKQRLRSSQIKATAAALNSSLGQAYVEIQGLTTGGGMVQLEAHHAAGLRIPDILRLPPPRLAELSAALDSLEMAARSMGGAQGRNAAAKLEKEYDRLDRAVAQAVGLSPSGMASLRSAWETLLRRRITRATEPSTETLKGVEQVMKFPKRKSSRKSEDGVGTRSLDEFG